MLRRDPRSSHEHALNVARIVVADAIPRRSKRPIRAASYLERVSEPLTKTRERRQPPAAVVTAASPGAAM